MTTLGMIFLGLSFLTFLFSVGFCAFTVISAMEDKPAL